MLVLSCGERSPTEPVTLASEIDAVPVYDVFYNTSSILDVPREILIDSRATQIEWDAAGTGNFVKMSGSYGGGGGDYYADVRAEWTRDKFQRTVAFQLLLQWPDLTENRVDHPIVNDSIDVFNDAGQQTFDCTTDDRILRPTSWHRASDEEDQVIIEIFSKPYLTYSPLVDNWRWGAGTTDPANPVSPSEYPFDGDVDTVGATSHPLAGFAEDRWDQGSGPVDDDGPSISEPNYTTYPNGVAPRFIASKGARDSRLNRSKPTTYTVWKYVAQPLRQCDLSNPVRLDDPSQRDKSWNPGDYVPGWVIGLPIADPSHVDVSSADVLARGSWLAGKWSLEMRRKLDTGFPDDLKLVPPAAGGAPVTYGIRITIRDGTTKKSSRSSIIPLVLLPVKQ